MKSGYKKRSINWVEQQKRRENRLNQQRETNAELSGEKARESIRESALRLLDRRSYSRGEINEKLVAKGYRSQEIDEVLDRFEEVGILDDLSYAQMLVRTRHQQRHLVGRVLYQELEKKHIPTHLAEQAMEEISGVDMSELATSLARNKAATTQHLPSQTRYRRLSGYLIRKGFTPAQVTLAIRTALAEYPHDAQDEDREETDFV